MSNEKMDQIANRLLELSQQGKVNWSDTADEDKFFVAFPDYSVSITKGQWGARYILSARKSAAQYIGRTQKGIQALRAKGLIPYHRIDRRVHYDIRDLDAWIEKHKVKEREER